MKRYALLRDDEKITKICLPVYSEYPKALIVSSKREIRPQDGLYIGIMDPEKNRTYNLDFCFEHEDDLIAIYKEVKCE